MISKIATTFIVFLMFASVPYGVTGNYDVQSDLENAKMKFEQLTQDYDNATIYFPEDDPGIPIYARVGPILNQFFVTNGYLVIPFYRDPECIRDNFNLLNYYDPPAAFGCELIVKGKFVIETDAKEGAFPIMAHIEGIQMAVWIVGWPDFQGLMESGPVTIADLEALNPMKGLSLQYEEYLSPRLQEHEVIIEAGGIIEATGEEFTFSLTHRGDQIERISLDIK
jgi:hypothetical protein